MLSDSLLMRDPNTEHSRDAGFATYVTVGDVDTATHTRPRRWMEELWNQKRLSQEMILEDLVPLTCEKDCRWY